MTEDSPITAPRTEASRHAITAIVFATAGLLWLFVVGPVLALVFAGRADRELAEEPGRTGRELAAAARTVAIVALVLQGIALVVGLVLAVVVAVAADDAVDGVSRVPAVSSKDAARAFTDLCEQGLGGDSGACGCALDNARQGGITDAVLARDVAQYRETSVVPEDLAPYLQQCGVSTG